MLFLTIDWVERQPAAGPGEGITGHSWKEGVKTRIECKRWCEETDGCNNIAWREEGDCWLRKKCLTKEYITKKGDHNGFMNYYKPCEGSRKLKMLYMEH